MCADLRSRCGAGKAVRHNQTGEHSKWRFWFVRLAAGIACCTFLSEPTIAAERPLLDLRCASRDINAVTLIERLGESQEISAEVLVDAFATVARARRVCASGDVADALGIYDSIALSSSAMR
jgi:hypothetical protein